MDLSKLPKLSNTPQPPENQPESPGGSDPVLHYAQASPGPVPGAEAIFSLIVGLILLLVQQNLLRQFGHWFFGAALPALFFDGAGRQFAYTETNAFIADMGLGIFAVALILEGLTLFIRRTPVLVPSFLLMIQAALWNLYTVITFYGPYGLQLMPALAVAFSIYIGMMQWGMLQAWWRPRG